MVQPQITSFIDVSATPSGNHNDQSASSHVADTNPQRVTGTQSASHDPPRRYPKMSKHISKAERRRRKPPNTPVTHPSQTSTPLPGREHNNELVSGDNSVMFDDRSLTELLMSHPASSSSPSGHESTGDREVQLQSQLAAAAIRIEGHLDEKRRLQNQVELLMADFDTYRKNDKRQKVEIRNLTNEND